MRTRSIGLNEHVPYWGMLKNLDDTVKLELIALLSDSVAHKPTVDDAEPYPLNKEERKSGLLSMAGCWKDDEDTDQMSKAVLACRKNDHVREYDY